MRLIAFLISLCFLISCQRVTLDRNGHDLTQQVRYSLPDTTQGLSWAVILLSYPPLVGFKLPVNTVVTFETCDGDVNAYYFRLTQGISVCYPLLDYFASIMPREDALAATMWVIGHELGHAIVDINGIPVIRGEDVADSFAVWFSTEEQSLAAMRWFNDRAKRNPEPYPQGEHSSAAVRYYNIQCWLYGATKDIAYFVPPWERDCATEWENIDAYWQNAFSSEPPLASSRSI